MNYYEVIPLKIVHGNSATLTYQSEQQLLPGLLVMVPLGKSGSAVAIVIAPVAQPSFATKSITDVLDPQPLPPELLATASWMATYYATHPVQVWQTILPRGLSKKRRSRIKKLTHPKRDRTTIVLNKHQRGALATIQAAPSGTILLHGITGSGKTQIYIESAKRAIAAGRSVIILVPEIALTSQLIAEFQPHFPDAVVTHSTMTESERHTTWQSLLHANAPQVVIGPRSALFSPLQNIGLIVIDECHEPAYKQEQSPRYSALRVGAILARQHQAHLVLGSATPSVNDYYMAHHTDQPIITLSQPAKTQAVRPAVTTVDMTIASSFTRHRFLSNQLLSALEQSLADRHQSLIFHNRRGSAPSTMCEHCGWNALCDRCFVPLTLHTDFFQLRCHICNATAKVPTSCPDCGHAEIIHKGIGTKLIHQEIARLLPQAKIARFDGDTDSSETLEKQYQSLYDGSIDIIIGTQVVAKGLDLPQLRTVGVVQADAGLALPDYQSAERTFQLLAQVCGRVGRNEHQSSVIVQSYQPSHPAIVYGIAQDYMGFYAEALRERKRALFPPFTHLLKLICIYKTEATAVRNAQAFARSLRSNAPRHIEILGPTPAFYERVRDTYRWQIIVKSPFRSDLVDIVRQLPVTHWQYELDPASLL